MKKTPSTRSYTTLEEELKLHHGGGPKVCEHQREGGCFDCLEVENARLQEMQGCSACKAIHYLHPNAKQGDFSGPRHAKVGTTCSRCGEMWPCDVTELREGYARLLARVEEVQGSLMEAREEVQRLQMCEGMARDIAAERDGYKALAERRKEALEEMGCEQTLITREGCREAKARGGNLQRSEWCIRCAAIEEEERETI